MHFADKFRLPIIALIDTAGANPESARGAAHRRGHRGEPARMMVFRGPDQRRGQWGRRLPRRARIGVADRVLILENAYYSVISPEGCAAILWKDRAAAPKAAEALKITAKHLLELGLVDEIVPEPLGGAHTDPDATAQNLSRALLKNLGQLLALTVQDRLKARYEKFRKFGHYMEQQPPAPAPAAVKQKPSQAEPQTA